MPFVFYITSFAWKESVSESLVLSFWINTGFAVFSVVFPLFIRESGKALNISGDEIISTNRFVHLPEDWEREDKNNETFLNLFRIACFFSIVLLIIYAGGLSIAKWSKGSFNLSNFKVALSLLLT